MFKFIWLVMLGLASLVFAMLAASPECTAYGPGSFVWATLAVAGLFISQGGIAYCAIFYREMGD